MVLLRKIKLQSTNTSCVSLYYHTNTILMTFLITKYVDFFPTKQIFATYLGVLQLSFYLEIASDPTDQFHKAVTTPLQMTIPSPGCHLGFLPINCNSGIPMTSCLGLINSLEQRTEFRKTFTYVYQLLKGYDKRYR